MSIQTVNLYIGLLILMLVNIFMGTANAMFEKRFNYRWLVRGMFKMVVVTLCFCGTSVVGLLNPDIIVINLNGTDVDVRAALHIVILTSYYHYARQVIEKLISLLNENVNYNEDTEGIEDIDDNKDNDDTDEIED